MEVFFQAKMVGYQHESMRREVRRVIHDQLGGGIRDVLTMLGRALAIILCVVFFTYTVLFAIGASAAGVPNTEVIFVVMLVITAALVVVVAGYRKRPDPLKVFLWPPEATVVTASFFSESFQTDEAYILHQAAYPAVQAVLETDAAYYLFVGQEHMLMLRKREFTQGGPEQFRDFIAQKTGRPVEYVK